VLGRVRLECVRVSSVMLGRMKVVKTRLLEFLYVSLGRAGLGWISLRSLVGLGILNWIWLC
jgi:hypothetical protein